MTLEKNIILESRDVEVTAKSSRRRFTADEKRRIVRAAEACTKLGEITALLRREVIYWTYLSNWRKQFKKNGLTPAKMGRRPRRPSETEAIKSAQELEKKLARMTARAERTEALVDLQKKVAALLIVAKKDDN